MDRPQTVTRDNIDFPNAAFPFLASTTAGVNPGFQRLHWHHALELNYIRSGSGFYLINGVKLQFEQGDLIFINSNDLHRAFETDNLVMDVIMFNPSLLAVDLKYDPKLMTPFREADLQFNNIITEKHPISEQLTELFMRMMNEYDNKDIAYVSMIRADLVRFLGLSNRDLGGKDLEHRPVSHRGMSVLKEVLRTIELNLGYAWTLQELAELAHLSPSRFSTLFHQTVGTSPLNYLIQLRLTQAVHLLETTEDKIIDIAEQCGFRNLSNFNRLFKHHIGIAPSELRDKSSKLI